MTTTVMQVGSLKKSNFSKETQRMQCKSIQSVVYLSKHENSTIFLTKAFGIVDHVMLPYLYAIKGIAFKSMNLSNRKIYSQVNDNFSDTLGNGMQYTLKIHTWT